MIVPSLTDPNSLCQLTQGNWYAGILLCYTFATMETMPVKMRHALSMIALIGLATLNAGCSTKSDTKAEGAFVDAMMTPVPFDTAWSITRDVLLEKQLEIHTRDKRGMFVVYTDMHRQNIVVPHRTKLTITLSSESDSTTRIAVETVHQKYGVTLLKQPEWRDQRDASTDTSGTEILESIKSIISRNQ